MFKRHYPELYEKKCDVIAVSVDGGEGVVPSVKSCLPNAVQILFLFHFLKNVSSNKYDPARL